jgi:hypothetical protein
VHVSWKNFGLFTFFQSIFVNCFFVFLVVVRNFDGFEFNRGININVQFLSFASIASSERYVAAYILLCPFGGTGALRMGSKFFTGKSGTEQIFFSISSLKGHENMKSAVEYKDADTSEGSDSHFRSQISPLSRSIDFLVPPPSVCFVRTSQTLPSSLDHPS